MNEKTTIDHLLQQLPPAQTGADFTEKLLLRIDARQQQLAARKNTWGLIAILAGITLATGLSLGLCAHFFEWPPLDMEIAKSAYTSFVDTLWAVFEKCRHIRISPVLWKGLTAGIFLLLLDGFISRRKAKKQLPLTHNMP
jgi:hypothetical protein